MHTLKFNYMTDKNKQNNYSANRTEMPIIPLTGDMLNTQIETGCYQVELKHEDVVAADLPLAVCAKEHYIIGYLFVSELGSRGTLQSDRVIGQTLLLNGCKGNSPVIYRRQGKCSKGATKWENWSKVIDEVELKAELKKHSNELKNQMVVPITWGGASHIDRYVTAGIYSITGERLNLGDGLPIANSNPGHTIHARLMVLDSSIGGTGDAHDKCITQVLMLSNRTGGDGDVYIRTGRAASKGHLSGGTGWEQWGKLQQNVEVGQVNSLDSHIGNGIYSGVYTNGSTFFETFVMVVINNYAVAGATGQVRNISQFKYALNLDGTFSYKTRRGHGNDSVEWGEWVDLGAASTTDIQDGAITEQKLSTGVREKLGYVQKFEENAAKEKKALVNGDTIVGLAREVYSRQGKVDNATFLKRTTAGGTSVSDGVATLKHIGGNIVKNIIGDIQNVQSGISVTDLGHGLYKAEGNGVALTQTTAAVIFNTSDCVAGHKYYMYNMLCSNASNVNSYLCGVADANDFTLSYIPLQNNYQFVSAVVMINKIYVPKMFHYYPLGYRQSTAGNELAVFSKPAVIDLTEMFGAGNEPTKEECDRMFACMGALPQGLTVAQPTGLKSIGYNQWNPDNVLEYKSVSAGTVIGVSGSHIAVIECLPCKTGTGENNGYVIGYGEGDTWSDEGIEVYLTPLNPLEVEGELYLQKLEKDTTYNTYLPCIMGYLLVVTPVTNKLCAHLHWSGDRAITDYEEYIESNVTLPAIPQMSEWGLAGISSSGTVVQDTIDLENNIFRKRIWSIDLGELNWKYATEAWNVYSYDDKRLYIPKRMLENMTTPYIFSSLDYNTSKRITNLQYNSSDNSISITSNEGVYVAGEVYNFSQEVVIHKATCTQVQSYVPSGDNKSGNILCSEYITISRGQCYYGTEIKGIGFWGNGYLAVVDNKLSGKSTSEIKEYLSGVKIYYEQTEPEEYPIVTKTAPNYIGSDYGTEKFVGSKIPLVANILFYMRSLVSETRNFLDRLMAGLGTSDATTVADKIIAAVNQHSDVAETEEVVE